MVAARCPTPSFCKKAGIRSAPFGGGLFAKMRDGELAQHSRAVRPEANHGDSQILAIRFRSRCRSRWQAILRNQSLSLQSSYCKSAALSYQRMTWNGGFSFRAQQLDHGGDGSVQIGKLAVGKPKLGRGPQASRCCRWSCLSRPMPLPPLLNGASWPIFVNGRDLPQGHDSRGGIRGNPDGHHHLRRHGIHIQRRRWSRTPTGNPAGHRAGSACLPHPCV